MRHIEIILDLNGPYYPGQTISGRVECNLDEETKCRAVKIRFKGKARTRWTVKRNKRSTTYTAEEVYYQQEYILVSGQEELILPAGRHAYPFSYILPLELPSSFEGAYGSIKYSITALVDRPWKIDYEYKMYISVASILDLNYLPSLRQPFRDTKEETVCDWCCRSGPIEFNVTLPITGYVPNQDVNINAYVKNLSNVNVEAVRFTIKQVVQFIAHHPYTREKWDKSTILQFHERGIGAHGEKTWTTNFKIPLTQHFPNLNPCNIINDSYTLKIELVLPALNNNLEIKVPLTIGSVPISSVNVAPSSPPSTNLPSYSALPSASAPPSYESTLEQYGAEGSDASKPFLT